MNFGNFPVFNPQIFSDDTYPCFTGSFQNNLLAFWRPGTMPYPDKFRLCVGVTTSESPPSGYVECQDIRMAQAVTKPTIVAGMGMWNGKIDLKCMVSVFPRPEFKWYYNGMEVVEVRYCGLFCKYDTLMEGVSTFLKLEEQRERQAWGASLFLTPPISPLETPLVSTDVPLSRRNFGGYPFHLMILSKPLSFEHVTSISFKKS